MSRHNRHWPDVKYNGRPLLALVKASKYSVHVDSLPKELVNYLLYAHLQLKLSNSCFQVTLSIISRYLRKEQNTPYQLLGLSSLFIAHKNLGTSSGQSVTLSKLHNLSSNSFTTKDFLKTERRILLALDFNVLKYGIPNHHIFYLIKAAEELLDDESTQRLESIVKDVEATVWYHLFTCKIQIGKDNQGALSCAILQISMTMLTQLTGRFDHVLLCCNLAEAKEKDVNQLSSFFLKAIIGKDSDKFKVPIG